MNFILRAKILENWMVNYSEFLQHTSSNLDCELQ